MKITVCAQCGSQDLERLAWVTHRTNQYIDEHEPPTFYCNNCGGSHGEGAHHVVELEYSEKHGCAYRLEETALIHYPMFKDGSVQAEDGQLDGSEIDYGHCIAEEGRAYYEEIMMLFPTKQGTITKLFWPHLDVKSFVADKLDNALNYVFTAAHQHFKTKSGDIEPLQQVRLDQLQADLVDLITAQVKENL